MTDHATERRNMPLHGVHVLDLGQVYLGPYAGFLLAQAGADVIKIEPVTGEPVRHRAKVSKWAAVPFEMLNGNKRGLALNLKSPEGIEILKELVRTADILLENYAPGVMDRLGVGWDVLSEINPRLIYGSGTGFGLSGPDRDNLAMDITVQACSGMMSVTGFADGPPVKAGPAVADFISGVHLYAALATALYERSVTGRGRLVEVSMQEAVYPTLASNLAFAFDGEGEAPRTGNHHGAMAEAPYNVYPTLDGHVAVIALTNGHWRSLLAAIGRQDLAGDARFATSADRVRNMTLTDAIVGDWTRERPKAEVTQVLRAHKVPAAPVRHLGEVINDVHMHQRGALEWVDHAKFGRIVVPSSPLRFHGADRPAYVASPELGEHNAEILLEHLRYEPERIAELAARGVIGSGN
ncbi:CaiB/BaiF CoA transferase family protein [Rhodopseudomonas sp. P2A-2r]|uniref:CaiB/BaiF CoA transferase family protein n=1 Tax=unclassified Rhodopseudomonas TaxID=2638247 RepID=UPI002234434B|nr:CoA transferase [Rhodopseudomonas sp. P2A-2r]UZE51063.1 CoA transferase [Rhodopseudomonas sp. P2A-2r]